MQEYIKWITDNVTTAKNKVIEANKAVALAEFGKQVFDVVMEITEGNAKFAYQIGTSFDFDRILVSKEFTDEEKKLVEILANTYKNLQ